MDVAVLAKLKALTAIAQYGSVTRAATALCISPSAVSQLVAKLEIDLKISLFNRAGRKMQLTSAAVRLIERSRPFLSELDEAIEEARKLSTSPAGRLKILCARAVWIHLLDNAVSDFLDQYPQVDITVCAATNNLDIFENECDAGIAHISQIPDQMIASKISRDVRIELVASPTYIAKYGAPTGPRDLINHWCVIQDAEGRCVDNWTLSRDEKTCDIPVKGRISSNDSELAIFSAIKGIGISRAEDFMVSSHIASGHLVKILPEWGATVPGYHMFYPDRQKNPTALRAFVSHLRRSLV